MIGIAVQPDGIAVASTQQEIGQTPRLKMCEYRPVTTPSELTSTLENIVSALNTKDHKVVTVMAPTEFNLLLLEAPQVDEGELKAAVRWKVKDMIDYDIEEAVIDVFHIPSQKGTGRAPMIYVVAARADTVRNRIAQLENNGLGLDIIDIPDMVQRNIAALLPEDDTGVAFLAFTDNGGLITLTRRSTLYLSRALDTGLTQLIASETGNPQDSALSVTNKFEAELKLEEPNPDQQQALESVTLEVQRSLDYYESHFSQPHIGSLVIAPLPQHIPDLTNYFASQLGLQVRILDLNGLLDIPHPLDMTLQSHCLTAIGASLRSTAPSQTA